MKYKVIWISLVVVVCVVGGYFANQMFMQYQYQQILKEVLAYQEAEKTSYSKGLEQYKKAKKLLETYLKRYPKTSTAKSIKTNFSLLGKQYYKDFIQTEPSLTDKAKAEKDLLACSCLVAKHIETEVYDIYDNNGRSIKDQMIIDTLGYDPSDEYSNSNLHLVNPKLNSQDLVLSNIANELANIGKYEEAKQMLLQFDDEPDRQFMRIGLLAYKAIKANKKEEALNLLDLSMSILKKSNFEILNVVDGLELISEGYRLVSQNIQYFQTIGYIKFVAESSYGYYLCIDDVDFLALVDHLIQLKNKDLALKVMQSILVIYSPSPEKIGSDDDEIELLAKIMIRLISLNRPDLADEAMSNIKNKDEQASLQNALANQYFKSKQPLKAFECMEKAKKLTKEIEWLEDQVKTDLKIIKTYHENKMEKETLTETQEMIKYLAKSNQKIGKLSPRPWLYEDTIELLLDLNMPDQAIWVANKEPNPDDLAHDLYLVASYYIKSGYIEKAIKLANNIHGGYRWDANSSTYQSIAEKYLEENNLDKALFYIGKANTTDQANFYLALVENAIKTNQITLAKEYLNKAFKLYKVSNWDNFTQESLSFSVADLCATLREEKMLSIPLNDGYGNKDVKLVSIEKIFIKQNDVEKFFKYLHLMDYDSSKTRALVDAISPDSPEKIREAAYQEAIKTGNKAVLSLYHTNQAKQHIEKKEYEKALALVEKINLYYDKATILTLLAIHWEKPNLSGANGEIMHRIVAGCK